MANWIQRFITAIATHKGDVGAHHTKYTDAEAKTASVQSGAITNGVTKAPTHDAVFDVKATADAAQTAAEVDVASLGIQNMVDIFGLQEVHGDGIWITVQSDATPGSDDAACEGTYRWAKAT